MKRNLRVKNTRFAWRMYDVIPHNPARRAVSLITLAAVSLAVLSVVVYFMLGIQTEAAAGDVILLWEGDTIPEGWTCISCTATSAFFGVFPRGSSTYATASSGQDVATHTASFVSHSAGATTTNQAGTGNALNSATVTHGVSNIVVASSDAKPPFKNLRFISAGTSTLPNGAIGIFDVASSSLPANWSYYESAADRFIRGEDATTTGGSNSHAHTITATATAATADLARQGGGTQVGTANGNHEHSVSGTINQASNTPSFVRVVFAKLTATSSAPAGLIALFDAVPPSGWTSVSGAGGDFNGRFIVGSDIYGATGGADTHAHTTSTITSGAPTLTNTTRTGANSFPVTNAHTHGFTFGSISTAENLPVYRDVIFAKKEPAITVSATGTQTATVGIPSSDFHIGGALAFMRDTGTTTVTQITITDGGTVNASSNLSNVILFYKEEANCSTTIPADATQFNSSGVPFNSSERATATGTMTVGTTTQVCVYVRFTIGSGAADGQTIEIEISDPSTEVAAASGAVQPNAAVAIPGTTTLEAPTVTVATSGIQTATTTFPRTNFNIGGAFTLVRNTGTTSVTEVTITDTGTVNASSNLSGVTLFYKEEATCGTSIPGDATQFNAATANFNSSEKAAATGTMTVGTSQICLYVRLDIGGGANASDTIDIEISDPSTEVAVSSGSVTPATVVGIPGITTLQIAGQILRQKDFRIYANVNAITPVSPLAAENTSAGDIAESEAIRIRMNVQVENSALATTSQAFKLQFAAKGGAATCGDVASANFGDVGRIASGTIWRGFNNTSTGDGTTMTSTVLASSTVAETYEEENPTASNTVRVAVGGAGEWDFVIQNNGASSGAAYCFRMVKDGGSLLDIYGNFPEVTVVRPLTQIHYRWRNDDGGQ